MEVPKDNTFSPQAPPVSGSLYLMAAAQMHADGYFNQTFKDVKAMDEKMTVEDNPLRQTLGSNPAFNTRRGR